MCIRDRNLGDIMNLMKGGKADVAFVVDPDEKEKVLFKGDRRLMKNFTTS